MTKETDIERLREIGRKRKVGEIANKMEMRLEGKEGKEGKEGRIYDEGAISIDSAV